MSGTEFSFDASDLGAPITIDSNRDNNALPFSTDKSFKADTSSAVRTGRTLGNDFSLTTTSESQTGTLTQAGSTISFTAPNFPNLTLFDDGDPTITINDDLGDISVSGTVSQGGNKSFAVGVDPVTFQLGITPEGDQTIGLEIGDDTAALGIDGVNGQLTTVDGRLAVDPLTLEVAYNPNTDTVVANAAVAPEFDLDDAIRLSIFARAGLSSDPSANPSYAGGFVINAEF